MCRNRAQSVACKLGAVQRQLNQEIRVFFQFRRGMVDDNASGCVQFFEFTAQIGLCLGCYIGHEEGDQSFWSRNGTGAMTELERVIDLCVGRRHFGYFQTGFLCQPVMYPLPEENVVVKLAFTCKVLNFLRVSVSPRSSFLRELNKAREKMIV